MKIVPLRKTEVSFAPPVVEHVVKPVGLIADTVNHPTVDRHRSGRYTLDRYWIHVSDLIRSSTDKRFCPREYALMMVENKTGQARTVSPGMALLHRIGHAVQEHLTNDFISRSPHGGKIWGNWKCPCRNLHVIGAHRPGMECPRCRQPFIYEEIDLVDDENRIVGHPDLIVVWNGTLHIYEIKTIDREAVNFETLDAPLGDHTIQATMYYWMARKMHEQGKLPYPVSPFIDYVYADRSNRKLFFGKPYKEFTKRASPHERIEPMLANAKAVKDALANMVLPPRICKGSRETRAKHCGMCVSCFSRTKDAISAQKS